MTQRNHWPSRWIFILAAIGSAAGLGNIWRFPFLAFEHGGAAFILVLILANIVVGIPLLIAEIGLGQMTQRAAPDAFGTIQKRYRYLGWLAIVISMLVVFYFMVVMGWSIDYLASAFTIAWGTDTTGYFFENILQLSDGPGDTGGISWSVLSGLLLAWTLVYFSIWKGIRSVSAVIKWTATMPFVILAILLVRALTLDGALDGVRAFFIPNWDSLADPQLWIAAFSQVFFSLSLAFGIMIAYGSFNRENTEITKSAIWIASGNFLVSIMSGLVVFGTLGWMAREAGTTIMDVAAGGPSLIFIVYPQAISLLPALNALIAVIFFIMIASLAIDSAFSLLEAFSAAIRDRYPNISLEKIALVLSIVGFIGGLPFATGAGLYYLDILDHFIVNYAIVTVGILEAIVIGWLWRGNQLREYINQHSTLQLGSIWSFAIKIIIPVFLTYLLIINLIAEFKESYEGYPTWALIYIGVVPILLAPLVAFLLEKFTGRTRQNR